MRTEQAPAVFYTKLQRRLHWLVIFLLAGQYLLQNPMRTAMEAIENGQTLGFLAFLVTSIHSWSGISIAALMLWRWQLRKRYVPLNDGKMTSGKAMWVTIHHISLYVVVVAMAIVGALHYYLEWPLAAQIHKQGKWVLAGLILVHIAGALAHVGGGSNVLRRMMGRDSLR